MIANRVYNDEPDAASHALPDKVPAKVASARARKLMGAQRKISKSKNRALVGTELDLQERGESLSLFLERDQGFSTALDS